MIQTDPHSIGCGVPREAKERGIFSPDASPVFSRLPALDRVPASVRFPAGNRLVDRERAGRRGLAERGRNRFRVAGSRRGLRAMPPANLRFLAAHAYGARQRPRRGRLHPR